MSELARVLRDLDALKKAVRAAENKQIFSKGVCEQLHAVASTYFSFVRPTLPDKNEDVANADMLFRQLHDLSRKNPSRQKCLIALTDSRKLLIRLEGAALAQAATKSAGKITANDELIISSLKDLCPPAAASYSQALEDLAQTERNSWRGPATELREALRETLDKLAPDKDVETMPGFKTEADAKRPTMKQKVRFILRNRGMNGGQIETSEDTVKFVEDSLGGITRSVYNRTSVSTHMPTTRDEVVRIHALVRLLLCELLAIPLT